MNIVEIVSRYVKVNKKRVFCMIWFCPLLLLLVFKYFGFRKTINENQLSRLVLVSPFFQGTL